MEWLVSGLMTSHSDHSDHHPSTEPSLEQGVARSRRAGVW